MTRTSPALKEPVALPIFDAAKRSLWHRAVNGVAIVAAIFCLFIAGRLAARMAQDWRESPLVAADATDAAKSIPPPDSRGLVAQYRAAKLDLAAHPEDENIKTRIRVLDQMLRQRYFIRHAQTLHGAYLLLGGLTVLALALKARSQWSPTTPGVMQVFAEPADPWRTRDAVRIALAAGGVVVVAGLVALGFTTAPSFFQENPPAAAAPAIHPDNPAPLPTLAERMQQWPGFRGPLGSGIATVTTAPTDWDGASGRGVLWKTPIPLPGKNSPIVWGDKIFLTGATEETQEVYCFNATSGALVWRKPVKGPVSAKDIHVDQNTGYAACTMATDGLRVYAMFPTGDLSAFDFSGENVWMKNLGKPDSQYGFAASLATYKDRVIVQFDQGSDESEGKSALLAFDGATGNQLWRTRRDVENSWASPLVIYPEAGPPQIVTAANPCVIGYDAQTGTELWKARILKGDIAASPAFAAGKVFVANDQAKAAAIRIDGHGDITKTHVLWTADDGLPEMVSPLARADSLLLISGGGVATCYNSADGKQLWDHEMEAMFLASPVLVGKTVYLLDTEGVMHTFEAGAAFREIGKAQLGEEVSASPAFVPAAGGKPGVRIFIRGKTNLYCIGESSQNGTRSLSAGQNREGK